jgi:two-component system phosphate regulon sensor histidine kinase PhoR
MDPSILEAIFGAMEQGVVLIDDRNQIVYCNPAAEKIRNLPFEKIFGKLIFEVHPDKSHPKVSQVIQELKSGRVKGHHRMNIQMVEGKFYDNTYSAVWGPNNQYLGVIVVSQDVTKRREAEDKLKEALKKLQAANEELRHLNQMKDDFFSNVSHELKTPMISVIGYMGMMLRGKFGSLPEDQRKVLEISYKNLLKLGKNIDDLLELAELGIRKKNWVFETIDLSRVIEFSCSTVEPLAREHQIQLSVQLPDPPVIISGVEDKLHQLFNNLLMNAIKFNRQGGKIGVDVHNDDQQAFIHISDTGVGISRRSLKEVFNRHFQGGTQSLGKTKGLGIGLSLAQEIVDLHRGKILIESEVDKGTTFTVMLPTTS